MVKIYCLTHPTSSRLYIGKTIRTLDERLAAHIYESNRFPYFIKSKWIRSLVEKGFKPEIKLIIEVDNELGNEAEIHYIKLAKQICTDGILNSPQCLGGEGFIKGGLLDKNKIIKRALTNRRFTNEQLQIIANRINAE